MAFKDISVLLYDDTIRLDYKDETHHYQAWERVNFDLPVDNKKAWGPALRPKGTTTLMDEVLEKKGLMTWPMGMALQELFGFYDFTNEKGEKMTGFSKGKGTLWEQDNLSELPKEAALPYVLSASKNWTRRQKKGADIGSVVHNAIEHYLLGDPYDIAVEYRHAIETSEYETETLQDEALGKIDEEVEMAKAAFNQFHLWWTKTHKELVGSEQLVYSKEHNISGTFDGLIRENGKLVLCDWKTSNASVKANAPEGVYYSYFIQSAIYAMAYMEMCTDASGAIKRTDVIDDIAIISCRKDGGFAAVYASEFGLSVDDLIGWAKAVITCYNMAKTVKKGLMDRVKA